MTPSEGIERFIRPDLATFGGYSAHTSPETLEGKVEVPVESIIKIDANENPYGCSPRVNRALAEKHYAHLKEKPFYEELLKYIQGAYHKKKVMALVYYGKDAIAKVRELAGSTNPEEADSVSIRGAYGRITTKGVYENAVHSSTSEKEAEREIKLWFQPEEIIVSLYPTKVLTEKNTKRKIWA